MVVIADSFLGWRAAVSSGRTIRRAVLPGIRADADRPRGEVRIRNVGRPDDAAAAVADPQVMPPDILTREHRCYYCGRPATVRWNEHVLTCRADVCMSLAFAETARTRRDLQPSLGHTRLLGRVAGHVGRPRKLSA
jgi:hypothetical protein